MGFEFRGGEGGGGGGRGRISLLSTNCPALVSRVATEGSRLGSEDTTNNPRETAGRTCEDLRLNSVLMIGKQAVILAALVSIVIQ
ncbi:hypothetical protein HYFRA_00004242 [Hymenoscyphus fraxineus]|uniref:Uncharacterized protein n=1 Tax=Hymenoscyphus fraxineus TaxID=746836 RepID=A0A9N9PPY4_9HELO|nr:hypothetical protein HYFRA_00004242 [Hymenoscyphus fraxineus]